MAELTDIQRSAYAETIAKLQVQRTERILNGSEQSVGENNAAGGRSLTIVNESLGKLEMEINRLQRLLGLEVEDFSPSLRPFAPENYC